jgi:hypothetical protein
LKNIENMKYSKFWLLKSKKSINYLNFNNSKRKLFSLRRYEKNVVYNNRGFIYKSLEQNVVNARATFEGFERSKGKGLHE